MADAVFIRLTALRFGQRSKRKPADLTQPPTGLSDKPDDALTARVPRRKATVGT